MHCEKVLWLFGIGFKFLAQTYQVRIHCPGSWEVLVPPNLFQKTIATERFARMTDEVLQQLKLFRGDIESLARPEHSLAPQIDFHVSERVLIQMFGNHCRASQHGLHSRQQLAD